MKLEDVTEKEHSSDALEYAPQRPGRPTLAEFTAFLKGPKAVASIALVGIFVLLTMAFLHFARAFVLPVVLAIILSFLFGPGCG